MKYFISILPNGKVLVRNIDTNIKTFIELNRLQEYIKGEQKEKEAQNAKDEAPTIRKTKQ